MLDQCNVFSLSSGGGFGGGMGSGMGHMGSALGTRIILFVLRSCKSFLLLWGGGDLVLILTIEILN